MSYNFDGKLANQCPKAVNLNTRKTICEKCGKILDFPEERFVAFGNNAYNTFNYLSSKHFIYETKSGRSVTYCSKYCRDKHNHRFAK